MTIYTQNDPPPLLHLKHVRSPFLLLSESLGDEETDLIVEVSIVDLFVIDHFPHLTGVAAPAEVHEDDYPIDEQDQTDGEQDY